MTAGTAPGTGDEHDPLDTNVAHIARVYNYWLGGKDNFAADREAGDQAMAAYPNTVLSVRANRAFLARTVRYLAGPAGIRQFLDIGTGIPAENNTHEVAQATVPAARIVYVDNDPIVLTHARALLTSSPAGATAYIDADLRDTGAILGQAAATLDFSQPVAVMLIAILHLIGDDEHPGAIVRQLMDAVPPGSYLAMSHVASDIDSQPTDEVGRRLNQRMAHQVAYRGHADVSGFFDGLDLLDPGVVPVQKWRPDTEAEAASPSAMWGGVARKG